MAIQSINPIGAQMADKLAADAQLKKLALAGKELTRRMRWREDYIAWCRERLHMPDIAGLGSPIWDKQDEVWRSVRDNRKTHCKSGHKTGKMEADYTVIDTPNGRKRFDELVVGDIVFGVDGHSATVIGVFPKGILPLFRVTFDDGSFTDCGAEHLWTVQGRPTRKRSGITAWETITTKDLIKRGLRRKNEKNQARLWRIPRYAPVEYSAHRLPIPAYALGVWIGDGGRGSSQVTSADPEMPELLQAAGQAIGSIHSSRSRAKTIGLLGIAKALQDLNLWQCGSATKRVPRCYLEAPSTDRLAILQGLMDTDGTVGKRSHDASFCSTSEGLVDDVIWLTRSLGGKAFKQPTPKKAWYRGKKGKRIYGKLAYQASIHLPEGMIPFRLQRKAQRIMPSQSRRLTRWIDKIEPISPAPARCIRVDREDGLYLTRDFIVTHNTLDAALIALWFLDCWRPSRVITTSASWPDVKMKLWGHIRDRYRTAGSWFGIDISTTDLKISDRHYATGLSCDRVEAAAGHNEKYVLVVIDEASSVSKEFIDAVEAEATRILEIGNPLMASGPFYQHARSNEYQHITISCYDHPNVKLGREVIAGGPTKEWCEDRLKNWGANSPLYLTRVLGEFPEDSSDTLFPINVIQNCFNLYRQLQGKPRAADGDNYMGLDIARQGGDETVGYQQDRVAFDKGTIPRAKKNLLLRRTDHHNTRMRVAELWEKDPLDCINIDAGGEGSGPADEIAHTTVGNADRPMRVNRINFGADPAQPDYFNTRSEMFWQLSQAMAAGMAIEPDEKLEEELVVIGGLADHKEKMVNHVKRLVRFLLPKDEVKEKLGRSPDRADALALANYRGGDHKALLEAFRKINANRKEAGHAVV